MRKFDFEILDFKEKAFIGHRVEVLLEEPESVDYKSLWNKVREEFPINNDEYYIGFEDYESFNGKMFYYYALAPKRKNVLYEDVQHKNVPKGRYYVYENTLEHHGADFFKAMYQNLKKKGVLHDSTFDLEIISASFSYDNPKSPIYVGVLTKEY